MLILSAIFIVQFTCFYHGLDKTTASHGVLISNLLPFGVLILAHYFIPGERVSFKKGVGIIFGFAGVCLLFFDSQDIAASLKSGDIIVLAAVLFWSTNVVFIKIAFTFASISTRIQYNILKDIKKKFEKNYLDIMESSVFWNYDRGNISQTHIKKIVEYLKLY